MSYSSRIVFIVCAVALLASTSLFADDSGQFDRKGFMVGASPVIAYETNVIKEVSGGFEFRVGYAFSDRFQLYYDSTMLFTEKNSNFVSVYIGEAKAQAFLVKDFYAKLGIGFSGGQVTYSSSDVASKWGFETSGGFGYEFKVIKNFVIAPEAVFSYSRIEGRNYIIPQAMVYFGWYM